MVQTAKIPTTELEQCTRCGSLAVYMTPSKRWACCSCRDYTEVRPYVTRARGLT
jgi:ribosomal protein S27AE